MTVDALTIVRIWLLDRSRGVGLSLLPGLPWVAGLMFRGLRGLLGFIGGLSARVWDAGVAPTGSSLSWACSCAVSVTAFWSREIRSRMLVRISALARFTCHGARRAGRCEKVRSHVQRHCPMPPPHTHTQDLLSPGGGKACLWRSGRSGRSGRDARILAHRFGLLGGLDG